MMNHTDPKHIIKTDCLYSDEYTNCIQDLLENEFVCSMSQYIQHCDTTCLEHCLHVSYDSYRLCRRLGLDYRSTARGGLLHDFFLYDWHIETPYDGLHAFIHPRVALQNANRYFDLNALEKDIIVKHMWPLTLRFPLHRETFIVMMVDKYYACEESFVYFKKKYLLRFQRIMSF